MSVIRRNQYCFHSHPSLLFCPHTCAQPHKRTRMNAHAPKHTNEHSHTRAHNERTSAHAHTFAYHCTHQHVNHLRLTHTRTTITYATRRRQSYAACFPTSTACASTSARYSSTDTSRISGGKMHQALPSRSRFLYALRVALYRPARV